MNIYAVAITVCRQEQSGLLSKNHVDIVEAEGPAQAMGLLVHSTWKDGWHLSSYSIKDVTERVEIKKLPVKE